MRRPFGSQAPRRDREIIAASRRKWSRRAQAELPAARLRSAVRCAQAGGQQCDAVAVSQRHAEASPGAAASSSRLRHPASSLAVQGRGARGSSCDAFPVSGREMAAMQGASPRPRPGGRAAVRLRARPPSRPQVEGSSRFRCSRAQDGPGLRHRRRRRPDPCECQGSRLPTRGRRCREGLGDPIVIGRLALAEASHAGVLCPPATRTPAFGNANIPRCWCAPRALGSGCRCRAAACRHRNRG